MFNLTVEIATQGSHSGLAGGILPDTWRIITLLLKRLEDTETGKVIDDLHVEIPQYFFEEAKQVAALSGDKLFSDYHLLDGVSPISKDDLPNLYLNGTWRPSLTITGVDDIPPTTKAGNVIRKSTTVKVSVRLPPTLDGKKAEQIIKDKLSGDAPYGAKVTLSGFHSGNGFACADLPDWLRSALDNSSEGVWGKGHTCKSYGVGGSIPFLATLGEMYPKAKILAVGVGSAESNAHNPNEFIVLHYAKNLIKALSHVLYDSGK